MSPLISILADLLVAILLTATIATSIRLSRRINKLKADEDAMRITIGELVMATETAERAISGLRTTLTECDRTLAERLRTAERYAADLAHQVDAGQTVMNRIVQIVESSRQADPIGTEPPRAISEPSMGPNSERLSAAVAAAQALTERAVRRLGGAAA